MPSKKIENVLKEKKIAEILTPRFIQVPPETTVKAAVKMMQENKSGYVVVAKKKKLVGVFTETDLHRKVLADNVSWTRQIVDFVDPHPVVLTPEDSIGLAIDTMSQKKLYYIPLVDKKKELVNILSVRTLIRFLAAFYPNEVYNLPPKPGQISTSPEGG